MPPNLAALRNYARQADVSSLPASVLFSHTSTSLAIFDAYPKAIFHFLLLPRILSSSSTPEATGKKIDDTLSGPFTAVQLTSLRTLLKCERPRAKNLLLGMREEALKVKASIEEEMIERYGFKWTIHIGFHAVPSMEHIHLHIISSDMCSPALKNKKHYNSFHPKLGFYLHLDDVLGWFDADEATFTNKASLKEKEYEPLLKESLVCFRCDRTFKNIPTLKAHLQEEFDKLAKKAKDTQSTREALERKRKREVAAEADDNSGEKGLKRKAPSVAGE